MQDRPHIAPFHRLYRRQRDGGRNTWPASEYAECEFCGTVIRAQPTKIMAGGRGGLPLCNHTGKLSPLITAPFVVVVPPFDPRSSDPRAPDGNLALTQEVVDVS